MAVEIGSAYFTLIPSMAGTAAAVQTALGTSAVTSAFSKGGSVGGAAMGVGLLGGFKKILPTLGIASAVGGIANFFGDSIDAASNLNESANAVRVVFGDTADEIERLGSSAADRLGLSNVNFNTLAVRLASFAGKIAGDGGDIAKVIDSLTTRAADFGSVMNIDAADALDKFRAGLSGQAEPLQQYGINLLDSEVKAYALANGIGSVTGALTEDEKVQARYGLLLQETADTQGDFARTSDELAGQQRKNAAKWEETLAKVGEALIPAATAFAGWVGSDANVARLEKIVDLFVRLEPAITGVADASLVLADAMSANSFEGWATIVEFIDAVSDGMLTVEEKTAIIANAPDVLRDVGIGLANTLASWANGVIGMMNAVRDAVAGTYNFISDVLGFGGTISFTPIPLFGQLSMTGPNTTRPSGLNQNQLNQLGFPGMASGGQVAGSGWSWVGERGPELAFMPSGAEVQPLEAGRGIDLSARTLRTLVEAMMAQRVLEADGRAIAETTNRGNARGASLGAA